MFIKIYKIKQNNKIEKVAFKILKNIIFNVQQNFKIII